MKKYVLIIVLATLSVSVKAQSYIGFLTDNYSGVHGVIANPANITDSRFKTDINLVGFSSFFANDYFGGEFSKMVSGDFDLDEDAVITSSENNNFNSSADVMGPSLMFNIGKKSSIAIFTRVRGFGTINELNGTTFDNFRENLGTDDDDFVVSEGNIFMTGNTWAEIGLTYARTLMNNEEHFLKGGLSIKRLRGIANIYGAGFNINVDYDADGAVLPNGDTGGTLDSTGEVNFGRADDYDSDDFELPDASGLGFDLGFVYEWRPDYADYQVKSKDGTTLMKNKNKYKLKLGLSVTDMGSVTYKSGIVQNYDITANISQSDYDNIEDLADIQEIFDFTTTTEDIKAGLPTALHINADWSFNNHFYLNLNTDIAMRSSGANLVRTANIVSLTPRFESKWFSFYLPISSYQYSGMQMGAGLRLGLFYLGSGSLISTFTRSEIRGADAYAGVKIPVYYGSPKDSDDDGIPNKVDGCPKEAGPVENNGCPWGDADGDTILDNVDACVDQAGPIENNGCPWGDADGDTLLDNVDECVNQVGPKENNGCPWPDTDGDAVIDKEDNCPDVMGTVANKGCPEPEPEPEMTEVVQKSLNEYAKTILFTTGKSEIKDESTAVLVDIISILNEYPSAKFVIEGHTDSVGSEQTNQRLSESRAQSVLDFLINGGIDAARLTAIGYGESKPIATNMYKDGREKNRRVEINLVK